MERLIFLSSTSTAQLSRSRRPSISCSARRSWMRRLVVSLNALSISYRANPFRLVILNDEMVRLAQSGRCMTNWSCDQDDFATPGIPDAFGLKPSPFNFPAPGKRPLSSTSPLVMDDVDGETYLAIGGSGGSRIFGAVAQVILNLDWGYDVGSAIEQPRVHDQLSPAHVCRLRRRIAAAETDQVICRCRFPSNQAINRSSSKRCDREDTTSPSSTSTSESPRRKQSYEIETGEYTVRSPLLCRSKRQARIFSTPTDRIALPCSLVRFAEEWETGSLLKYRLYSLFSVVSRDSSSGREGVTM